MRRNVKAERQTGESDRFTRSLDGFLIVIIFIVENPQKAFYYEANNTNQIFIYI